jgi:hypothetical protein
MDPTCVILTFHTIDGKPATEENERVTHYAPKRLLGPFSPAMVRSVVVGDQVALYGNVLKRINGVFVEEYIHLRAGRYTFTQPFHWLTMHLDTVKAT